MKIETKPVGVAEIDALREAYRAEAGCQIVYDSFLPRGIADARSIVVDGDAVGYAAIATRYYPRHIIEFYVVPEARAEVLALFDEVAKATRATHVRAQTNIPFMTQLLFDTSKNIAAEKVLFGAPAVAPAVIPAPEGSVFRHITEKEAEEFSRTQQVLTDWVLEAGGEIVATAGYLTHYNPPYGDVFMAVADQARRRGYGGYIVQEICRVTREAGKIPAARCDLTAVGSRRALERGGLVVCGHLVYGEIAK